MGKFIGIITGAVVTFAGLLLLISWWYEFLFLLRGAVPPVLILGGSVALLAGMSELKDVMKSKKK